MTIQQYDSQSLQQYREKALEVAELRKTLGEKLGHVSNEEAQRVFDELTLRTKELENFRTTLGPKDLFIAKYNITVINDHTVSFVIPKGCSRMQILEEAAQVCQGQGILGRYEREAWNERNCFVETAVEAQKICIDGHVEGSDAKTEEEQISLLKERGLARADYWDLAVACAVFYVATGEPIFGWADAEKTRSFSVRADPSWSVYGPGALYFDARGLSEHEVYPDGNSPKIAVAAIIRSGSGEESPGA